MGEHEWLAEEFEKNRGHLRAVAYRMLGSVSEADDAVQEGWLRLSRSDANTIENLGGWLTTVVARVCLDMLRTRSSRKEEALESGTTEPVAHHTTGANPEGEAVLADSVGVALLIVLDRLEPAERLAFVLHDMFAVPFDEIASIIGRTPEAARQLASRARRRVQGAPAVPKSSVNEQRQVVSAFLEAVRTGDFEGLLAVLDPDIVVRVDEAAGGPGGAREIRGAQTWAKGAIAFSQKLPGDASPMLIDGEVGVFWVPPVGTPRVLLCRIEQGKMVAAEIVGDTARIREMELSVLGE
jgi:RNA polymerase sigma factor (sigma-70 family)